MRRFLTLLVTLVVFGVGSALGQVKQVTGVVTSSDDKQPIPGVSVFVKEAPSVGASTDVNGKYTLKNVPANAKNIVFSFVGYTTLTLPIKSELKVELQSQNQTIDEVMVVAYGTAKKSTFTGSASSVKKEDIVKTSGGVAKAIQGKVAGVQVVGDEIRIRGYGSFSASGTPLYVVDGIIDAPKPRDEDIETFTVLKDAASTALYGSRAANGVIIINSKKGKKDQKPVFNVKYQKGISTIIDPNYKIVNADQHFRTIWLGLKNANNPKLPATNANVIKELNGNNPYNMLEPLDANGNLKADARMLYSTDWKKEAIKDAAYDQVDVSATGGSANSTYYWSMGYTDAKGMTSIDKSKTLQTLFNFSTNLTKRLEVGLNTTLKYLTYGSLYTDKANENNLLYVSRVLTPTAPLYKKKKIFADPNNTSVWTYENSLDVAGNPEYDWANPNYKDYNPIALLQMDPQRGYGFRTFIAPYLTYKVIDGLVFKANAAVNFDTDKETSFQNPLHGSGQTENGLSTHSATHYRRWYTHASFDYNFKLAELHNFELFAGAERQESTSENFYGTAAGYDLGDVTTELSIGAKPRTTKSSTTDKGVISYISFLKYNYNDRYYFDASLRRDGSSKFGKNNKWGNFWSLGFSWRMKEEAFLKDVEWVNNLKYRISYGVTGTDAIDSYRYGDYYSLGINYLGNTGISHTNLPNPDLGWEQSNTLSTGFDFTLFNMLNGTVEVYNKLTTDLLLDVPVAYTTGFSSIFKNVGKMQNRGIEVELSANLLRNAEVKWTPSLTVSHNQNKIKSLPQDEIINGTKRYVEGKSMYDFYLRDWAGVDPQTGDALWYKDVVNNGKVEKVKTKVYDDATRYMIGRSTPDVVISLSNSFNYKGFDFSFQLYSSLGGKLYDGEYAGLMHDGANKVQALATDALNSWTTPGQVTDVPKYVHGNLTKSNGTSTRYIVDGTFYKLKNISFGWTLPSSWLKKASITSTRLFLTGDNLVIISDFKSGDPERYLSGVADNLTLPNTRVWRFGVSVQF
jgi:TonB-linked SusC/RagA family outer membrane protein